MRSVFLSHGGESIDVIRPIVEQIERAGFKVISWDASEQERLYFGSALQQLEAADVTVVVLTARSASSAAVAEEVDHALERGKGLLAVKAEGSVDVRRDVHDAGAEVLDWLDPEDVAYLERGLNRAERGARVISAAIRLGTGTGKRCARPQPPN